MRYGKLRNNSFAILLVLLLGISIVVILYTGRSGYLQELVGSRKQKNQHCNSDFERRGSPDDDIVVIYNRIPKTGSTSFIKIVNKIHHKNQFSTLYLNISKKRMRLAEEAWIVRNISHWKEIRPVLFHGHFGFPSFQRIGSSFQPIFINIVRDPLERLVSFYYFLRHGDDFRPGKKRSRMGDKTTIDECVKQKGRDCSPEKLWLQIPYFCGYNPQCWSPGSKWALNEAKRRLADSYFLVGVSEEMEKFILVLDYTLPQIFKGAAEVYAKGGGVHLRKTKQKHPVLEETIKHFKTTEVWKLENEFYQFARRNFMKQYNFLFQKQNNRVVFQQGHIFHQNINIQRRQSH